MITLDIKSTEALYFKLFKSLYDVSFPIFEQRTEVQQNIAFCKENYHLIAYIDENDFVGFISYWDFESYVYIEHFAVNSDIRGKGYGSKILNLFIESVNKIVLLEIDPIVDEVSAARMRFYKRNGFYENIHNHVHPAYREAFDAHHLIVMSTERIISDEEYLRFKSDLCEVVMRW